MKMMFPTVSATSDEMIKFIKNSKFSNIEMKDILGRFTTDVIGSVAFGLDINSMKDPTTPFRVMGLKVFNLSKFQTLKILFAATFNDLAKKLKIKIVDEDVSEFFMSSIKETIDYREENKIQRNDFFNLLLELKNHGRLKDSETRDEVEKLTFNELAAQAFLFFIAGEIFFVFIENSFKFFFF
jgi:cytochrome P450 family 6